MSYDKKYALEHKQEIKEYKQNWYLQNKTKSVAQSKRRRLYYKTQVLTHYGNGKLACVRCSFSDIRALSIDHINGGGFKHRRSLGINNGGGLGFYLWLIRNNLPMGYQTLCMNCQYTKKIENDEFGN